MHTLVVAKDCSVCNKLLKEIGYDGSGKWKNMKVDELELSIDLFFDNSFKYRNVVSVPSLLNGDGALVANGYEEVMNILK